MEAAALLLRDKGISATTTREIARTAGLSDTAIYSHFKSRGELLKALIPASLVDYKGSAEAFLKRVGQGTVEGNLKFLMKLARDFFQEASPKIALILAWFALLAVNAVAIATQVKATRSVTSRRMPAIPNARTLKSL